MNKKQHEQYNMLETINTHFDRNATIWSSDVLISDAKTALSAKLDQIMAALVQQTDNSTGVTIDKALLRKDLEVKAFSLSTAICAYTAINPGQDQLHQRVFVTKAALFKMRETDLLYYTESLYESAETVLADLGPYRVTAATLAALMDARTAFFDMIKTPREITINRRAATEAIPVLLREAVVLLKDTMDRLMEGLRDEERAFVSSYFNERRIHRIGSRTVSLEILTLNAADNTPLADAFIEVVGKKIKRISSEKGLNRVQNLKEGNYTLSVSHPDFVTQLVPFTVINHETTKVVVELGLRQAQAPGVIGA